METKAYETRHPLLAPAARERLRDFRARLQSELHYQIKALVRRPHKSQVGGDRAQMDVEVRSEVFAIRKEIVACAVNVAAERVRDFADALLLSQGRLGAYAVELREYTASLVNEMRGAINTSGPFQSKPLPLWTREDPIADKAMRACEETITERQKGGDRVRYGSRESYSDNPVWDPVVRAWEAYKVSHELESVPGVRMPEAVLRSILADQCGITPQAVDRDRIRQAGAELCRHYGPTVMVPLGFEANCLSKPVPEFRGDAQFWKEREEEFRRHDTAANSHLSTTWFSMDGNWRFASDPGTAAATTKAKQLLQSLAREAAKGFSGPRSGEPWMEWLEALRCAVDKSTGERLYSRLSATGQSVLGERELERMAKSGEPIPAGGLIEFIVAELPAGETEGVIERGFQSDAAEMRMLWETAWEKIEDLFASSANFCLELRSRTALTEAGEMPLRRTILGRNLDKLRLDCGWSFDELAQFSGVDKKLINNHVNKGKGAHPRTLALYAAALTQKLGRPIKTTDLLQG